MKIEIRDTDFIIDNSVYIFPIDLNQLINQIGTPDRLWKKELTVVRIWDKLGLFCHLDENNRIKSFNVNLNGGRDLGFLPECTFQGILLVNSQNILERELIRLEELDTFRLFSLINDEKTILQAIYISQLKSEADSKVDSHKYRITPLEGNHIEFEDFNFKLAVIQELMYEKELLKPKFDVFEFVKGYSERIIDLDEEGYDIIPEVKAYFESLQINEKYVSEITELYQDGGSDVYMNMIPFWDGENSIFNIVTATDAKKFPNLKKISLFFEEGKDIIGDFKELGIEADYL